MKSRAGDSSSSMAEMLWTLLVAVGVAAAALHQTAAHRSSPKELLSPAATHPAVTTEDFSISYQARVMN